MSLHNIGVVYRKELRDSLRDRRTLISMIVVPIVIMPLMTIGIGVLSAKLVGKAMEEVPKVMILGGQDSPEVTSELKAMKEVDFVPASPDYAEQISDKVIRAAVEIPPQFDADIESGQTATVKVYHYSGDLKSGFASEKIVKFFNDLRDQTVKQHLAARNLPASLVQPFDVTQQNVAPPEKVSGAAIGGFIPYFIIILCLTGAMYPAIDLTAGEKERGTIETVLCSPVPRTDLVFGKFFMVLTASLSTGILAMISMGATFVAAKHMLAAMIGKDNPLQFSIGLEAILTVFLMVIPVAVLFSAGLLAIALFAKSYKEAQSYISPLMIVVIIPAIVALLPGTELNARMALIPVLSTSLVCKEITSGTYHWNYIAMIFASTCVYAAAALAIAVKLFQREDVLFRT
jgi:sodium transport system permease protein